MINLGLNYFYKSVVCNEESNIVREKMIKNAMKFNKIVVNKVKTKNIGYAGDRHVFYIAVINTFQCYIIKDHWPNCVPIILI